MPRSSVPLLMIGLIGAAFWLERRRPLRPRVDPGPRRVARNAAMAAITAGALALTERPLMRRLTERVERQRLGLTPRLDLPRWLETALALVLLDYTLYGWHVLLHRIPFLWRFHLAHHIDRDLDASTALRFHFGEFLASIPWRAAQVLLIGVTPRTLALWQKLTLLEVVFHHSNLRLPERFERSLSRLVVTPRLHGIHHSEVRKERDSNFSSGLTVWDHVHRSICADVPQNRITIGVPPYRSPRDATLGRSLLLPFRRQGRGPVKPPRAASG